MSNKAVCYLVRVDDGGAERGERLLHSVDALVGDAATRVVHHYRVEAVVQRVHRCGPCDKVTCHMKPNLESARIQ